MAEEGGKAVRFAAEGTPRQSSTPSALAFEMGLDGNTRAHPGMLFAQSLDHRECGLARLVGHRDP
jgi:hypothetical protein